MPRAAPGGPHTIPEQPSAPARVALSAAIVLVIVEAISLVRRGAAGVSDISVFYRTCELLRSGVRAIYPRADTGTGWPISMPPLGFAMFQPFSWFGPLGSSVGWAAFNLALLAISVVILRRVLQRTGDARYERAWPWAAVLLLVLAAASVQVGQFSVLFVTCWLLFMDWFGRDRRVPSAWWLALPAAIKIYPLGLIAVPLSMDLQRGITAPAVTIRAAARYVGWTVVAIVVLWIVVPGIPYGRDTLALNVSWWRGVILNNAQMDYLQSLRAITNQSLDTVLLRYLSYDPAFHDYYAWIPHLSFAKATVLRLANVARLIIIAASAIAVWRGAQRGGAELVPVTALWVATLYNVVPETKARYAVYTFIAFLPWLARAVDPVRSRAQRAVTIGVIVGAAICALVFLPEVAQAWGVGFAGPIVLWIGNVRLVQRGATQLKFDASSMLP